MTQDILPTERFAPCPVCKQYSHSVGEDQLAQAFMHFQSMFSHRGDGIPTQHTFDEATRDAAQVLMSAARHAATARAEALEEAANKARDLYLFPPPTSRAARFHQRVTQDAISDAIRALVSDAGKSS